MEPKKAIQRMEPYDPPTASRKGKLRLDFNENSIGPSPKVLEVLKTITREDLSIYPECTGLREKLARYLNVNQKEVLPTNGTDEAILTVMSSFIEKDDEVILPYPTFAMFKFYASIFEAKITKVLYNDDLSFPTERVLDSINPKTKIVVIVNPNNPTGSGVTDKDILKILNKAKENNALALIDEAYYQFMGRSSKELIKKYDNLIILQTFSKVFGLAGIRLGYAIANKEIIRTLSKVISPYSVNEIAISCGIAALGDLKYVDWYVAETKKSKKILFEEFKRFGIKTYPTEANFFIAYFGEYCDDVYLKLKERNILVRNRTKYPLLKGCLRIVTGTVEQTELFLDNLREILEVIEFKGVTEEIKEKNKKKALIFDMDGVLVDESQSYRASVQKTVKWFSGKDITPECIAEYKAGGGLNNDWDCTEAILTDLGKNVSREEMIKEFQRFYLGSKEDNSDGLIAKEEWLLDKDLLNELSQGFALGIVTGRPRDEALIALQTAGTEQFFSVLLAMEDCEGEKKKPNPYGVLKCLKKLDCDYGYYIGDTGDDMIAAKNSSVVGIGVLPPQDKSDKLRELLIEKGAKKVIASVNDIKEVL